MRLITDEKWALIPLEIQQLICPPVVVDPNKKIAPQVFPIVRDLNVIIGNHDEGDEHLFFGQSVEYIERADIFDLLVAAKCFKSKNEARKNWRGIQSIPDGYFEIGPVGKSRVMIYGLRVM